MISAKNHERIGALFVLLHLEVVLILTVVVKTVREEKQDAAVDFVDVDCVDAAGVVMSLCYLLQVLHDCFFLKWNKIEEVD